MEEFRSLTTALAANPKITNKNNLIGPSVSSVGWSPEQVWEAGYLDTFGSSLRILTVERSVPSLLLFFPDLFLRYPNNNCAAQFGQGTLRIPQEVFPNFLTHNGAVSLVAPYVNSANIAVAVNKPLMMFETNTASCGGFAGISDSFGAALWAVDYGMQMAHANFSGALLHFGGQNVFYNAFTGAHNRLLKGVCF